MGEMKSLTWCNFFGQNIFCDRRVCFVMLFVVALRASALLLNWTNSHMGECRAI